jgi:hypothetical protein
MAGSWEGNLTSRMQVLLRVLAKHTFSLHLKTYSSYYHLYPCREERMIQGEGEGCIDLNLVLDPTFTTLPMLEPQLSALIADARKQLKGKLLCVYWLLSIYVYIYSAMAVVQRGSVFGHA